MGLLNYFGFDELADGIKELTDGFDELKQEIVDSVIGPGEELKDTVNEIAGSISGGASPTDSSVDPDAN